MLENTIRKYLETTAKIDPSILDKPEMKMKDIGLDSLGFVEMLFEIEDRYGFQFDDAMKYGDMGFKEMVADLEQVIRSKNNGQLPDLPDTL
jgi:acyl carrier protein